LGEISPIGLLFTLGSFFENYIISPNYVPLFPHDKSYLLNLREKWVWATFWAISSQTHLVTLVCGHGLIY
jgi:hypothetical protein